MAKRKDRVYGFRRGYTALALLILNTLLALVVINLALYPFFPVEIGRAKTVAEEYDKFRFADRFSDAQFAEVFPGRSRKEAEAIFRETYVLRSEYAPFIEFRSEQISSRYLNVDAMGIRSIGPDQATWPPVSKSVNVFVFGGSTTFGAGVADEQTVPAHLQRLLRAEFQGQSINVYNFGAGAYISQQERIRLEQLLIAGYVPALAVFIDGLNDFILIQGEPAHTPFLRHATETIVNLSSRRDLVYYLKSTVNSLPLARAARRITKPEERYSGFGERLQNPALSDPTLIETAIERYLNNKIIAEAAAKAFGSRAVFVWQPIPLYEYELENELMTTLGSLPAGYEMVVRSKYGYRAMRARVEREWPGDNFLWCADIQKGEKRMLYVDHAHYSDEMAGRLAVCIVDQLKKSKDWLAAARR